MWVWILTGLNIITNVHGYADGFFPVSCHSMSPQHQYHNGSIHLPQTTDSPFEIGIEYSQEGGQITVTLRGKQSKQFQGFMLEARDRGMVEGPPVGKFILLEPDKMQLLPCNNSPDKAVSQIDNSKKSSARVTWMAQGPVVDITLRATFVEEFEKFWQAVDVNVTLSPPTTQSPTPSQAKPSTTISTAEPSTTISTAEPSTTISTAEPSTTISTAEPSTTISTTEPSTIIGTTNPSTTISTTEPGSTIGTTNPSTTGASMTTPHGPIIFNLLEGVAIGGMNAVSFLSAVKTELTTLPNSPFSHRVNKVLKRSCILLCAAVEIVAMVLFCLADYIKVTLVALVCVAIVINFIELVIVCLPIEPSHELKEIADLAVKVCSVIHGILTIAVIFVAVVECDKRGKSSWPLTVTVAYTVWILLFVIWVFVKAILARSKIGSSKTSERFRQQRKKKKLTAAEGIVTAVSAIFIVGNLCFAVAVTVGIFGCQER